MSWKNILLSILLASPAFANPVDIRVFLYHALVDPITGEPCGGTLQGADGRTQVDVFMNNVEMNARDRIEQWPERRFVNIDAGEGGTLDFTVEWSPGNFALNVPPGLQSTYQVQLGWDDRTGLRTDWDRVVLDPFQIVTPQRHYITRNGWTTQRPFGTPEQVGILVCNRPPAAIENTAAFPDLDPGTAFIGWRHQGGLGEAVDWSHAEIYLGPEPRVDPAWLVYSQFAWGSTSRTVRDLDCGRYFLCYRNFDQYGHMTETCDGEVVIDRCAMELDMAVPDMAVDAEVDAVVDAEIDAEIDAIVDAEIDAALPDAAPMLDAAMVDMPTPVADVMLVDMTPDIALLLDAGIEDAAPTPDIEILDAGTAFDASPVVDMSLVFDATSAPDVAPLFDATPDPGGDNVDQFVMDYGPGDPGGANEDASPSLDAAPDAPSADAHTADTGGTGPEPPDSGCTQAPGLPQPSAWWLMLLVYAIRPTIYRAKARARHHM